MATIQELPVKEFLNQVLKVESLEAAFSGFLIESKENSDLKHQQYEIKFEQMISRLKVTDSIDSGIKEYVIFISKLHGHRKNVFLKLLENGVKENLVTSKIVCEALLNTARTQYNNESYWCSAFDIVLRIIDKAEYKEVRDLIKIMLDLISLVPATFNVSMLPQLDALYRVFEHVFDRQIALFPAYLVLDEIQKKSYPKDGTPHWRLSRLLSTFVDSFKPTANMCSIAGRHRLLPVVNYPSTLGNSWKLDGTSGKFVLKGLLPYRKDLLEPQLELIKYVLSQPYSKDFLCSMLNLTMKLKQRCQIIEEGLVELLIGAMKSCSSDLISDNPNDSKFAEQLFYWQHLSSQLIYFVFFHHASLPNILQLLHTRLKSEQLHTGRSHLMWILLHFISGAIQKGPIDDFLPIFKIYDLLYTEKEALPLPPLDQQTFPHQLAAASIWINFLKKAENEQFKIVRQIPKALKNHVEYLRNSSSNANTFCPNMNTDFTLATLCNSYTANQESFSRLMSTMVDYLTQPQNNSNTGTTSYVQPISMAMLDTLSVHTKMSLIHNIGNQIAKHAVPQQTQPLSPALIETYCRVLTYSEIETLGMKSFMSQVLITAWRNQCWPVLHSLLEMFSYRLHHIPSHHRVQLLGHLHTLFHVQQNNSPALLLCMESTSMRLIQGLSSGELLAIPQFTRYQSEPKSLISNDSEELNKLFILTLARAIHVTGSETLSADWCKELLSNIMQATPITWSASILHCFPPVIREFYTQQPSPPDNKQQLRRTVEEEYRKWCSFSSDAELLSYFGQPSSPPVLFCILWKLAVDSNQSTPDQRIFSLAQQLGQKLGVRVLAQHLREFADYIVGEFAKSLGGQQLQKCIDALVDLVWHYQLVTLDRLVLCLIFRSYEANEAQVCLFIVQHLLLKPNEFKTRVEEFVRDHQPDYWRQSNWHEKQTDFMSRHPEKIYYEVSLQDQSTTLPNFIYFSNICLRFLPVLDLVIHRYLEQSLNSSNSVDTLLDQLGPLYKFHDYPILYLYNTLHYYENKLKNKHQLKRKLVSVIIGAFKDIRPRNWALSEAYLTYIQSNKDASEWSPDLEYYIRLVERLVDTLAGKSVFPFMDWRFNEFTNPGSHALHVTCMELMALPRPSSVIANQLIDIIVIGHKAIPRSQIMEWMNVIGLILTALPESYWLVLNERILQMMNSPILSSSSEVSSEGRKNLSQLLDFTGQHSCVSETQMAYLIALAHAVYHHASVGQISLLPLFLQEKLKHAIRTEEQFLFICHIVAPFLQRFSIERTRIVMEVTKELYEMLEIVDKNSKELHYMDAICDLLYHIKYMFTGDSVKQDVERSIRNLRKPLQLRLRFITHLTFQNPSDQSSVQNAFTSTAATAASAVSVTPSTFVTVAMSSNSTAPITLAAPTASTASIVPYASSISSASVLSNASATSESSVTTSTSTSQIASNAITVSVVSNASVAAKTSSPTKSTGMTTPVVISAISSNSSSSPTIEETITATPPQSNPSTTN